MTQAPTPGRLTSESVKLLVKGDLLRIDTGGALYEFLRTKTSPSSLVIAKPISGGLEGYYDRCRFAFIGRPDADGWMPWSGGENPLPGRMVECKTRNKRVWGQSSSDGLRWSHLKTPRASDIIAFRLAPTAPVEASGSEREDTFNGDDAALVASITALLDLPDSALSHRVPGLAKQLLASAASRLSLRPLALGGQQGDRSDRYYEALVQADLKIRSLPGTDQSDVEFIRAALSTTPARAEAQDEGAAGSFEERALMLTKKHGNPVGTDYEQGQNDMGHRMVTMAREADAALLAARAHPSPTPAADDDRVRIAVEALEGAEQIAARLDGHDAEMMADEIEAITEALAALKSTAAKEGGK